MTRHEMHLNARYFLKIKNGEKDIEVRLYDEKRRRIAAGDEIVFINRDGGETFVRVVAGLVLCADFDGLVRIVGPARCGWDDALRTSADCAADMEKYYSKEETDKYGAVGIVLEPQGD